jgi:hypothetical protein
MNVTCPRIALQVRQDMTPISLALPRAQRCVAAGALAIIRC